MFYIPNTPQWRVVGIRPDGSHAYFNVYDTQQQCELHVKCNNRDNFNDMTWEAMLLTPADMFKHQ